jgi:hypothetical protein
VEWSGVEWSAPPLPTSYGHYLVLVVFKTVDVDSALEVVVLGLEHPRRPAAVFLGLGGCQLLGRRLGGTQRSLTPPRTRSLAACRLYTLWEHGTTNKVETWNHG